MKPAISLEEARKILQDYPPRFQHRPVLPEPRLKSLDECPMCGWPKGQRGFLTAFVPVGHPLFGVLIKCPACWEGYLPEYLRKLSGLSSRMLLWLLDAMMTDEGRRPAWVVAKRFVRHPRGWMTVWGEFGVGKTFVLASIVNELRRQEKAAMYVVAPDLLDELRQAYDPDAPTSFDTLFAKVRDVPVLALDELGQVKMTAWGLEKLFQLLDYRYRESARLGTVIALTFEPKAEAAPADWPPQADAILSRMREWPDQIVEMSGGDVRPVVGAGQA